MQNRPAGEAMRRSRSGSSGSAQDADVRRVLPEQTGIWIQDEQMHTYIEYESEHLVAIIGPFGSRWMADDWARKITDNDSASWSGITVMSPEEAVEALRLSKTGSLS